MRLKNSFAPDTLIVTTSNMNKPDNKLHTYELVDWNKPKGVLPPAKIFATIEEAAHLNKGFALNGFTKRWVKVD